MKNKNFATIMVGLILIFAFLSFIIFMQSYNVISKSIEKSLGLGATDMATMIARNVHLTDADVARLKSIPYKDLAFDEKNKELEAQVADLDYSQEVQCVYLVAKISRDQVKNYVTEENKFFYKAEVGTPLNTMWLLDVTTDKEEQEYIKTERGFLDYFNEMERFSILRKYEEGIFKEKKPAYLLATDEYGKYIKGYSPVYTSEGDFVGMLAIDIHLQNYIKEKNDAFRSVILSSMIVLFLLCLIILFLYYKYTKADRRANYIDALTLAHNRRYINELLPLELNSGLFKKYEYLLCMMIDFDEFKKINDSYGHYMGDECLKMTVPAFNQVIGILPGKMARFGGEEFFAVVGVESIEQAKKIAKDLRIKIYSSDPMGNNVHITVSIGAYVMPNFDITKIRIEESIKTADNNLYEAKAAGRNCVIVSY